LLTSCEAYGRGIALVTVEGELDSAAAPALWEELSAYLDCGFRRLVLDLGGCSLSDAAGLDALADVARRAARRRFVIVAPRPELRRILDSAGPGRAPAIYPSVSEALRAC